MRLLRGAGVALDARLGDIQMWSSRGGIPVHGGPESVGVYNKISASFLCTAEPSAIHCFTTGLFVKQILGQPGLLIVTGGRCVLQACKLIFHVCDMVFKGN